MQQLSNLDVRGVLQHGLPGGELSLGHGEISLQGTLSSDAGHLPLVLHLSQHSSSQRKMAQFNRFSLSFFGCSSAQLGKLRLKCYFISLLFFRHHTCINIIQKDNILNLNKNKTKNRIRLYKAFITEPGNPRFCCKAVHTSPSHDDLKQSDEING